MAKLAARAPFLRHHCAMFTFLCFAPSRARYGKRTEISAGFSSTAVIVAAVYSYNTDPIAGTVKKSYLQPLTPAHLPALQTAYASISSNSISNSGGATHNGVCRGARVPTAGNHAIYFFITIGP